MSYEHNAGPAKQSPSADEAGPSAPRSAREVALAHDGYEAQAAALAPEQGGEKAQAPPPAEAQAPLSWAQAKAVVEGEDLEALAGPGADQPLRHLGGGMNKQAYLVKGSSWVALACTAGHEEAKWRALEAEIDQLLAMRAEGVAVPRLGEVERGQQVFACALGEQVAHGILEGFVGGLEADKGDRDFAGKVADLLRAGGDNAEMWTNAIGDLERLRDYLEEGNDVPDLQVIFEEHTGHILTIDPGDPVTSGNYLEKHQGWVSHWLKMLERFKPRRRR